MAPQIYLINVKPVRALYWVHHSKSGKNWTMKYHTSKSRQPSGQINSRTTADWLPIQHNILFSNAILLQALVRCFNVCISVWFTWLEKKTQQEIESNSAASGKKITQAKTRAYSNSNILTRKEFKNHSEIEIEVKYPLQKLKLSKIRLQQWELTAMQTFNISHKPS